MFSIGLHNMKTKKIIPAVIVLCVVLGAVVLVLTRPMTSTAPERVEVVPTPTVKTTLGQPTPKVTATPVPTPTPTPTEKVVTGTFTAEEEQLGVDTQVFAVEYNGLNFTPKQVRVRVGDIVIFRNSSDKPFQPKSVEYPAFAAPAPVASGGEFQFTFQKAGVWSYVDMLQSSSTGTIEVRE